LSNLARRRDQILGTPSKDHGSIHVVVEWRVFDEFLDKLSKVSEATSYEDYHLVNAGLLPVNVDKVKVYRKKSSEIGIVFANNYGKMPC
jgi:hypothetical protein